MKFLMKSLVRIVEYAERILPTNHTYHIERFFVFVCLFIVAVVSKNGYVEWIGVAAVFFGFSHATVANRLEEAEARRAQDGVVSVKKYKNQTYYFYAKEILWLSYFILIGAWSALVGVIIFLLYPLWRKIWRKYHISEKH